MGRMVEEVLIQAGDQVLGVVDQGLFEDPAQIPGEPQVIIDFSHPSCLNRLLDFAVKTGCALVLGTTGYTPQQLEHVAQAAKAACKSAMRIGTSAACGMSSPPAARRKR